MIFSWLKEKKLKMVWSVEKKGRVSFLVGTAHFSPYRFKKPLTNLIRRVDDVFFEGPLDPKSMAEVNRYGRQAGDAPSLYEALIPSVAKEMNQYFNDRSAPYHAAASSLQFLPPSDSGFLETQVKGVRPWMAFFTLWSSYLDWPYSIDLEAFQISQKLEKKVHFLETIEEQLVALDGIPFERIMEYVNRFKHWKAYKKNFVNDFLDGNLERLMSRTNGFPTRCESILGRRDEKFFEGIKGFFERGRAIAFFGLSHIPTIKKMFIRDGYNVKQDLS